MLQVDISTVDMTTVKQPERSTGTAGEVAAKDPDADTAGWARVAGGALGTDQEYTAKMGGGTVVASDDWLTKGALNQVGKWAKSLGKKETPRADVAVAY